MFDAGCPSPATCPPLAGSARSGHPLGIAVRNDLATRRGGAEEGNMRQRLVLTLVGAALTLAGFAGGVAAGSTGIIGVHPPVMTGSGYVGDHVVTLFSGGVGDGYEGRGSIDWRDADGTEHVGSWPDCLPATTAVDAIPFIGATLWHGSTGTATILWVDCRVRG
jgi:hypothetical protein